MNQSFQFLFLALGLWFWNSVAAQTSKPLSLGAKAPLIELPMQNIDGKNYSLADLRDDRGLLVIFSCNTCPFVTGTDDKEGWEGRYNSIFAHARNVPVGMVLINSNESKRPNGGDDMPDMRLRAAQGVYEMPYLLDRDNKLADAFGARTTPHVYLFDAGWHLVYEGAIDDNVSSAAAVKKNYLMDALIKLAQGAPIDPANTTAIGCSIKRK